MSKISNQLQELVNQKKQLATNLLVKGRPVNENMTLNELVPEVLNIASGDVKLGIKEITKDGTYYAYEDGVDGYSKVDVNILGDNVDFLATFTGTGSTIKHNVKMLGDVPAYAFYSMNKINELDLSNTKKVGERAFYNQTLLTSIIAPNKMTIDTFAFYGCGEATGTIKIADDQTVVEERAFYGCKKLNFELHDNITEVKQYAFYNCQSNNLTKLPSKLKTIGQYAFYQNSGIDPLKITEIPPLVTNIGTYAFQSNSLETIKIYDACTSISAYAFRYNSKLKSVEIGKGLKNMYAYTFANNTSLTTFTIHATTPPTILGTTFQNSNNIEEMRVPASALETYKSASNWSVYADLMVGIEGE